MNITEVLGFLTGALCVYLAVRSNIWTFPVGLANNIFFTVLFVGAGLYADAALQVVFFILGVTGWWMWLHGGEHRSRLLVTRTPRRAIWALVGITLLAWAAITWLLLTYTDSTVAVADAAVAAASLCAQYMLNRKWLHTWFVWIGVDVVSIILYAYKGLWLTSVLYVGFAALCVAGYRQWRAALPAPPVSNSHALVLGKFYPFHAGHINLIRTAVNENERVTVMLLAHEAETISLETRAAWIRTQFPDVELLTGMDNVDVDFNDNAIWNQHMAVINSLLENHVDVVYTSDEYGAELARRLCASWRQVDPHRHTTPISGTICRKNPTDSWPYLSAGARTWYSQRVVVVGAESTGTTTLTQALAAHYGTGWVPEFGREYAVTRHGGPFGPWTDAEFTTIVTGQIEAENVAAAHSPRRLLLCDTDVLATCVWAQRYLDHIPTALRTAAHYHQPCLYILTSDDIAFVQDGTRDGEHIRHTMTQQFRDLLASANVPWVEVRGTVEQRLHTSIEAITAHVDMAPTSPEQPVEVTPGKDITHAVTR